MNLIRLSVKNPVFVNLMMAVILIWGYITYQDMNREAFPQVSRDMITVTTEYSGASPSEMEQLVTKPIENTLSSVNGIEEIESHSVQSRSVVLLKLHSSVDDPDDVLFDVQKQIDQLTELPEQAKKPEVSEVTTNFPVITIGLSASTTESDLYTKAQDLRNEFRGISGVNDIRIMGKRDRKIWIDVNPTRSRHYDIYLPEIYQSVNESSLNQPGGRITGPVRELLTRTIADIRSSGGGRNSVARSDPTRPLLVRDIAEVYPGFEKWETRGRVNGKPGLSMVVFKAQEADAISIVNRIRSRVETINQSQDTMNLTLYRDISQYIKDRIETMTDSAQMALLLVLVALFLTLNGRIALMTALGIPVSVYGSFVIMNYFGVTVNMLTLFAFIIVLGIIVDDAIVITENIYRKMELGLEPDEAAVEGTQQVVRPIIATIATNIVAFLPLALIGGLTGKFMVAIPYVVTIALLVSLFEALSILPSHMAEFVTANDNDGNGRSWRETWLQPLRTMMMGIASRVIRFRYIVLAVIVGLMPLFIYAASLFPVKFFHMEDIKLFRINLQAPTGSSIDYTSSMVREAEKKLTAGVKEENLTSYVSTIGWMRTRLGDLRFSPERAQIEVELVDPKKRNKTGDEIIQGVRSKLLPFDKAEEVDIIKQQAGPPTGSPVEIEISGPDLETLRRLAGRAKQELHKLASEHNPDGSEGTKPIFNIQDNIIQGKTELQVLPRPEQAGQYQLTNRRIARTVNLAVGGLEASSFQSNQEEIEVMVRMDPSFVSDPDRLKKLRVPTDRRQAVPLGEVAELAYKPAPGQINRIDRQRTVMVSASVDKDLITGREVNQSIKPKLDSLLSDYSNYDYHLGGEYEEQTEAYQNLGQSGFIALLAIYTILAGLFNSFLEPFVIVLTVPFSFVGVLFGLFIMGDAITFTAAMGTVALIGIVVNDALILLKFIEEHNGHTANRYFSVLRAIRLRIRPVLLTTITTIMGLIPIGFEIGLSGVESFLSPMAVAIMYGLFFASLVTLVLVPMIYLVFLDIKNLVWRGLTGNR
ncbi:MAG: efflux RND transporter permease subunit [bacterium]